jgi:hypothetical protein
VNRNTDKPDYQGMRALMLTRVSTPKQEEMYGHTWQEMEIRKKLIEPLDLQLDEERHIIRDTYSGLEFRYRKALDRILEMAERKEFDVLCMEVLDRGLGRKGLPRELFRLQLRELGIRILTTDPNDHADDDTLEGQMMRLLRGYKSEEEINDFVRRSHGGKRAKATGDKAYGIPPKVVGSGSRTFGYHYIYDENGKRAGLAINYEVIYIEPDGTEWTEPKVILFIFEQAEKRTTFRQIAIMLNDKGIPSPATLKGVKTKTHKQGDMTQWQASVVSRMLRQTAYKGESIQFGKRTHKVPGKKWAQQVKTNAEEQIIVACPAIIDPERFDALQERLGVNKKLASRNNKNPQDTLLRAGLAICGHCMGNMTVNRRVGRYKGRSGSDADDIRYVCGRAISSLGKCQGVNSINARFLDKEAWDYAVSIITDPSVVDQRVKELKTDDETTKHRERTRSILADIRKRQTSLRKNLNELMQEGKLDTGTKDFLTGQLQLLGKQEEDCLKELADEQALQEKYKKLQKRIAEFHRRCTEWRENLNNPQFKPSYKFKRDAVEFFGISAIVWKNGTQPRYKLESRPPSIVSLFSSAASKCQRSRH